MCSIIRTETFLALLLSKLEKISFEDILKAQEEIEAQYPGIHIELDEQSLYYTIHLDPSLFEVEGNSLIRSSKWSSFFPDGLKSFFRSIPSELIAGIDSQVSAIHGAA